MTIPILSAIVLDILYLTAGIIICYIGKSLLEKGITGKFVGEGEVATKKFRIVTSSPGLVFLVAGLTIIVTAIIRQAEIPIMPTDTNNHSGVVKLISDMEKIPTIRLLTSSKEKELADTLYQSAVQLAERGEHHNAVDYLVRASALDLTCISAAHQDEKLKDIVFDPLYIKFAKERIKIAQLAQQELPLSAEARIILSNLQIIALAKPQIKDNDDITNSIIKSLPKKPERESLIKTKESLHSLLNRDPSALRKLLSSNQYRWILMNDDLLQWLKKESKKALSY